MSDIFAGGYKEIHGYILFALTSIHAGSGSKKEGFVDLPIQRDAFGYPIIWSSSIKGALRGNFHMRGGNNEKYEKIIFGSEEGEYMSSMMVTDAHLLFMAMRSLKGNYALVTTPFLLKKLKAMFEITKQTNIKNNIEEILKNVNSNKNIVPKNSLIKDKNKVILLEKEFEVEEKDLKEFESLLPNNLPVEKSELIKHIIILSDDNAELIKRGTLLNYRIAIDYTKKVVKALWTEEYLPELSMLYCLILATEPKVKQDEIQGANDVINKLCNGLGGSNNEFIVVLGGGETIGKGIVKFCKVF